MFLWREYNPQGFFHSWLICVFVVVEEVVMSARKRGQFWISRGQKALSLLYWIICELDMGDKPKGHRHKHFAPLMDHAHVIWLLGGNLINFYDANTTLRGSSTVEFAYSLLSKRLSCRQGRAVSFGFLEAKKHCLCYTELYVNWTWATNHKGLSPTQTFRPTHATCPRIISLIGGNLISYIDNCSCNMRYLYN